MGRILVNTPKPYAVDIEYHLLDKLGEKAAAITEGRIAAIVSDNQVMPLYGEQAAQSLRDAGFTVVFYAFPHGEGSKNGTTYLDLLNNLAKHNVTRRDLIIALGGGVVGDLAGFAAATYLRGIAYIQVPTTVLAMADSSVGGKTAIDLPCGKNLAGAFYQPNYVLCDPALLRTLPEEIYYDGYAEIIKCAILKDPDLFQQLEDKQNDVSVLLERAISIKRDYICEDEQDKGVRQALNLGHTIGHAIESASDYAICHGKAVAIGTAMIFRAAAAYGYCSQAEVARVEKLLLRYRHPIKTSIDSKVIFDNAIKDKKRQGDQITLVVPRGIGTYSLMSIPVNSLLSWIAAGA